MALKSIVLARGAVQTAVRVVVELCFVTAIVLMFLDRRAQCSVVWKSGLVSDEDRCCGPGCRTRLAKLSSHYDERYFKWQVRPSSFILGGVFRLVLGLSESNGPGLLASHLLDNRRSAKSPNN